MRLLLPFIALAFVASCKSSPPETPSSQPAQTATQEAPEPEVDTAASPAASPDERPRPVGIGNSGMAKLSSGEKFETTVSGCLATADRKVEEPATRSAPQLAGVKVSATGSNAVVSDEFRHQCCLEGAVDVAVTGTEVVVTENLTGDGCRCMCSSMLRTTVKLDPGTYSLRVVRNTNGKEEVVAEQSTEVKSLRP